MSVAKPFFPMFVDLSQKHVLVVGAGRIAARRIETLKLFCDDITVIAPTVRPEIGGMGVALRRRPYDPADLDGADLVIAATDDSALNADIARDCRARGIPVNVVSDPALCDFYFPGVAVSGPVVAGITASGTDHRLAKRATEAVRDVLEKMSEQATGNRQQ